MKYESLNALLVCKRTEAKVHVIAHQRTIRVRALGLLLGKPSNPPVYSDARGHAAICARCRARAGNRAR